MSEDTQAVHRVDFSKIVREDGTILDVKKFVKLLGDTKLYWVVLSFGLEWGMVLSRIADEFFGKDRPVPDTTMFLRGLPEEYPAFGRFFMPQPPDIYFMRKAMVPAEVLSVRFGVPVEPIVRARFVTLNPLPEWEGKGLPAPTVGEDGFSLSLH